MTSRFAFLGSIVAGLAVVAACSSSSNGNNGGGGGGSGSCAESISGTANTACGSCEVSHCSSQMSGIESGCSDLLACVCPTGTYNASLIEGCAAKAQEASCTAASQTMASCAQSNCASECAAGGGNDSGSPSGGGAATCVDSSNGTCYVLGNGDTYQCGGAIAGTLGTSCPTAGLVGCCLFNSPSDYQCFYTGDEASDCPNASSLGPSGWVTTLP